MKKSLFISPYYDEPSFVSFFNCISLINKTDWLTTNNLIHLNRVIQKKINLYEYLKNNIKKFNTVFFCSNSILLTKKEIIELSEYNKFVLISFDDEYQFYQNLFFAQHCKYVLCTEKISSFRYKYYKITSYFFPHPVQDFSNQIIEEKINNQILFIGNPNTSLFRREYLEKLKNEFDNVNILATGNNINERISDKKMYELYNNSLVVLNFTRLTENKLTKKNLNNDLFINCIYGFKGRPYEVSIAGGCCVSEWNYQLADTFTDKKDIIFFKSYNELKKILEDILLQKIDTYKIRKNAQDLVRKNYSIIKLSRDLSKIMKDNINTRYHDNNSYPKLYEEYYFFNALNHKININKNVLNKVIILFKEIIKNYSYYNFLYIFLKFIRYRIYK